MSTTTFIIIREHIARLLTNWTLTNPLVLRVLIIAVVSIAILVYLNFPRGGDDRSRANISAVQSEVEVTVSLVAPTATEHVDALVLDVAPSAHAEVTETFISSRLTVSPVEYVTQSTLSFAEIVIRWRDAQALLTEAPTIRRQGSFESVIPIPDLGLSRSVSPVTTTPAVAPQSHSAEVIEWVVATPARGLADITQADVVRHIQETTALRSLTRLESRVLGQTSIILYNRWFINELIAEVVTDEYMYLLAEHHAHVTAELASSPVPTLPPTATELFLRDNTTEVDIASVINYLVDRTVATAPVDTTSLASVLDSILVDAPTAIVPYVPTTPYVSVSAWDVIFIVERNILIDPYTISRPTDMWVHLNPFAGPSRLIVFPGANNSTVLQVYTDIIAPWINIGLDTLYFVPVYSHFHHRWFDDIIPAMRVIDSPNFILDRGPLEINIGIVAISTIQTGDQLESSLERITVLVEIVRMSSWVLLNVLVTLASILYGDTGSGVSPILPWDHIDEMNGRSYDVPSLD